MSRSISPRLRLPALLVWGSLAAAGSALAQAPAAPLPPADAPSASGIEQRAERIRHEDALTRVDELRVGGQTRSITVQPKTGSMPEYEVQPSDGARSSPGGRNGSETITGPRVWNLGKF